MMRKGPADRSVMRVAVSSGFGAFGSVPSAAQKNAAAREKTIVSLNLEVSKQLRKVVQRQAQRRVRPAAAGRTEIAACQHTTRPLRRRHHTALHHCCPVAPSARALAGRSRSVGALDASSALARCPATCFPPPPSGTAFHRLRAVYRTAKLTHVFFIRSEYFEAIPRSSVILSPGCEWARNMRSTDDSRQPRVLPKRAVFPQAAEERGSRERRSFLQKRTPACLDSQRC